MSSLMILAAQVFEMWCGEADNHMNAAEISTPATAISLGKHNKLFPCGTAGRLLTNDVSAKFKVA